MDDSLTDSPTTPRRSRARRALTWAGWSLSALLALLLIAGGALWWWAGTEQSLASTLTRVARWLPAGQTLESRDVQGSLRHGGHIGHLSWRSDAMQVHVTDAQIGWQLHPLLSRRVQLQAVRVGHVRIESFAKPDQPTEPLKALESLTLPVDVDVPFQIDSIEWVGPPAVNVQALAGRYRYEGQQHLLQLDGVDIAQGHYSGNLSLQGPAPMALKLALNGQVQAALQQERPLTLQAQAQADGTLAGTGARLNIQAALKPAADAEPAQPVDAQLQAQIAPWQPQPVIDAQARLRNIDLSWLLSEAPRTQLSGNILLRPDESASGPAWQASADLSNAAPAPWDEGGLPIEAVQAQLRYDATSGAVQVSQAHIEAGRGEIQAHGEWRAAPAPWQIEAQVRDVRPGLLHTQLAGAPIGGQLKAAQKADGEGTVIDFDAALKATAEGAGTRGLQGLSLRSVQAQGRWSMPAQLLDLRSLQIEAARVDIRGSAQVQVAEQAASAKLNATLPGASLTLDGRMAPTQGQGEALLQLRDASALQSWVEGLPGLADAFAAHSLRGEARLEARWQGGWQSFQQQLQSPGQPLPRGSATPGLNARLSVPSLALQQPAAQAGAPRPAPILLRDVRATLDGSLAQATLDLKGQAEQGAQRLSLDTRASGGQAKAGEWQLQLARLRAQVLSGADGAATTGTQARAPWTLALVQPFSSQIRVRDGQLDLQSEASSAALTGPVPGTVMLQWEPLRLQQRRAADGATSLRLQSKGRMRGLPMTWARAVGGDASLREMGISGDLVFDGDWDIDAGDRLRAQARVGRASGDLRVQAGEAALVRRIESRGSGARSEITMTPTDEGPGTPAGLRQAEVRVQADGDALQLTLGWDSARAGQIQAKVNTRLTQRDGGWQWPSDAPLSGNVSASLPQLGVWSMLAPPGWRVAGSLLADATLAGTRSEPLWNGTLAADGLSLRARVEGLDLRDGRLRATLAGDRLRIDDFTLHGGPASRVRIAGRGGNISTVSSEGERDGGTITVKGEAQWGATGGSGGADGTGANPRLELRAQINQLRSLVRADRQVTVSGDLQTRLQGGQVQVRGKVTADRAAITLPDESAPGLGGDVVVRSAAIDREARAKAEREAKARAKDSANDSAKDNGEDSAKPQQPLLGKAPDIAIVFDLGQDFAVQGRGITTRLEGALDIRATSLTAPPRVTGEVRTVQGQYRAYGQALDVENGLARFNGVVDNPQLDIFALRPNITQRAGVRITGSAQSPRVALYSDPMLSDAETLSWVILGRASAASGGEAILMQQAALALLGGLGKGQSGGSLASRFGLDEIGFKGPGSGGELSESAVTLGKRLSKDFYVTYESSLAGALGTLFIFYDLTRNLTLRGQAGQQSAVDLIYTLKYD